eukprot:COSAG03_NODE_17294_length_379_cov_0.721429_1_plen_40_part_01
MRALYVDAHLSETVQAGHGRIKKAFNQNDRSPIQRSNSAI